MADDSSDRAKKRAGHALSETRKTYEDAQSASKSTFRIEGVEDETAMDEVKGNRPRETPDKRTRKKRPGEN